MKAGIDFGSKPYNRCLQCKHRKTRCDGPRTSAMTLARWCEFMRDMKQANGLTNAYIAETSGVSLKTIERIMAQNCEQDIMRETARRIEDAIIGSSNQYPCILAFEDAAENDSGKLHEALHDLETALAENQSCKAVLAGIHESYQTEMQTIRDEGQRKISHLLGELEMLRAEIEYLKVENDRKAKIIDKIMNN